ncbi:uncharacterized protein [Chiloscyllium punctatum]|uniref:uncharacterized protein n=1 Tax=Chiloscyllium punctatum TaxID=137246 RepID=UPI003B63D5E3
MYLTHAEPFLWFLNQTSSPEEGQKSDDTRAQLLALTLSSNAYDLVLLTLEPKRPQHFGGWNKARRHLTICSGKCLSGDWDRGRFSYFTLYLQELGLPHPDHCYLDEEGALPTHRYIYSPITGKLDNWTRWKSVRAHRVPRGGNASTRINQLSVRDNHTYLCLVEYRSRRNLLYLIQKETRLQVHVKTQPAQYVSVYSLVIPLLILLLLLIVIVIIFITFRKKGGGSQQMDPTTALKRNDPGSSSIPGTDQAPQLTAPDQDSSILYAEIDSNRTGGKRFTNSLSEGPQPDSCTYASIVFDSNRKGGKILRVADSEETDVTYAAVVKTH